MVQYAIVNERERIEFEKKYHLPYGYAKAVISNDLQWSIKVLNNIAVKYKPDYVIERIDCGVSEIIYPEDRKSYYVEVDPANA